MLHSDISVLGSKGYKQTRLHLENDVLDDEFSTNKERCHVTQFL